MSEEDFIRIMETWMDIHVDDRRAIGEDWPELARALNHAAMEWTP